MNITRQYHLAGDAGGDEYKMRAPCRWCGHEVGEIRPKGGQNCVYCLNCGKLCYNAPKTETGEITRSLSTRKEIKPSQRARILERDNYACVACHVTDQLLVIGHLISVKEGYEAGMTDLELYDDENLAAFCEQCNAGQGSRSVSVILMWRLQQIHRTRRQR